ncbi:MAG: hypothetical protein WAS07_15810, partial [Micropruina sp.]
HEAVSRAVAELDLLPAIRHAGLDAVLVADGFSCRTQIADLTGRVAITLPELLDSGRSGILSGPDFHRQGILHA